MIHKEFSNQQLSDGLLAFNISKGLKFVPTPQTDANIYLHQTPTLVRLRTFRKTYAPKRYNGFRKLYRKDQGLSKCYIDINGCNKLVHKYTIGGGNYNSMQSIRGISQQ